MAKEKLFILILNNGIPIGYIKSVSWSKQRYYVSTDKMNAKKYGSHQYAMHDLRILESIREKRIHPELFNGITFEID